METKEFTKEMSMKNNGFLHLFLSFIFIAVLVLLLVWGVGIKSLAVVLTTCTVGIFCYVLHLTGLMTIQPNQSRVLTFFGRYSGTVRQNGFFWVNPFYGKRRVSLRARNMDVPPIKVNDKSGNPIMIGLVLVWKVADTYKAMFDIDVDNITVIKHDAEGKAVQAESNKKNYDNFVHVQSDAALRKVAGHYAYDTLDGDSDEVTLRSGAEEINNQLEEELRKRLSIAGIEVVEARINYLAYASEIASVMLRRQQADAIIAAREKIVDGAVSMVELALNKLDERKVVRLDEDHKAALVSNLMVVLCADESASPVINTGDVA